MINWVSKETKQKKVEKLKRSTNWLFAVGRLGRGISLWAFLKAEANKLKPR